MRALAGVRVLEYTSFVAGPFCGRLLADLGADVVKVEPPSGDVARAQGPFPGNRPHPDRSPLFLHLNTNKRGITLDVATPEGRQSFLELAAAADVVLDDAVPGALDALGLGYEELAKRNPRLVLTSITPYGQDGPRRNWRAHHINFYHATEGSTTGRQRDGRPAVTAGFIGDYDAGMTAGVATLAALFAARASGRGQHVDISRLESVAALQRIDLSIARNGDQVMSRRKQIGGLVRCKDGYVVMSVLEDHQWTALAELIERPEWAVDSNFTDRNERPKHTAEIQRAITAWAKHHTKDEIYRRGQAGRVPVGPVLSMREILASPHLNARGVFQEVVHPVAGTVRQQGLPFFLSQSPWRAVRPAPRLGEHDGEVIEQRAWAAPRAEPASRAAGAARRPRRPLEGIRVVDFTWAWAGAYATLQLALLGAEVIKVESTKRIDISRTQSLTTGQRFAGFNSSTVFNDLNLNKKSVRLDLSRPEAAELARRIIATSDVVAQNMRPGVMDRLGLGYEALRAVKPDIIMLSSSALGSTGPDRTYIGYAPVFSAIGGLANLTGEVGGPPVPLAGAVDLRSATMSAFAVLAALNQRAATGEGQHIDLSSVECSMSLAGHLIAQYGLTGREPVRHGNAHETMAPHNSYPCRDGAWLTLAVETDAEWHACCEIFGQQAAKRDARFATARARHANVAVLDRLIASWTRDREANALAEALQGRGVAATVAAGAAGLARDPQLEARGYYVPVTHPVIGSRQTVGVPWKLNGTPATIDCPSPLLGEHNREVLCGLLGLREEEVTALEEAGVVA